MVQACEWPWLEPQLRARSGTSGWTRPPSPAATRRGPATTGGCRAAAAPVRHLPRATTRTPQCRPLRTGRGRVRRTLTMGAVRPAAGGHAPPCAAEHWVSCGESDDVRYSVAAGICSISGVHGKPAADAVRVLYVAFLLYAGTGALHAVWGSGPGSGRRWRRRTACAARRWCSATHSQACGRTTRSRSRTGRTGRSGTSGWMRPPSPAATRRGPATTRGCRAAAAPVRHCPGRRCARLSAAPCVRGVVGCAEH